jgi:hypothetical protein
MGDGTETSEYINEISDDLEEIRSKLRKSRCKVRSKDIDSVVIERALSIAQKLKESGKI